MSDVSRGTSEFYYPRRRNEPWVRRASALALEEAAESFAVGRQRRLTRLDLGHHLLADRVDEVLGLVEHGSSGAVVETGRFGRGGRSHERAVRPCRVGEASLVPGAVLGAAP